MSFSTRVISTEQEAISLVGELKSAIPGLDFGYMTDPTHIHDTWQPTGYAYRNITINGQMTNGNVATIIEMAAATAQPYTFIIGPGGFPIPQSLAAPKPPDTPHVTGSSTGINPGSGSAVFGGAINAATNSTAELVSAVQKALADLASDLRAKGVI